MSPRAKPAFTGLVRMASILLLAVVSTILFPHGITPRKRQNFMPGEFDVEFAPALDEVMTDVLSNTWKKSDLKRVGALVYFWAAVFWVCAALSSLMVLIPYLATFLIFTTFGTVATVSWVTTLLWALMTLVSSATIATEAIWLKSAYLIATLMANDDGQLPLNVRTKLHEGCAVVSAHHTKHPFKPIEFHGTIFDMSNLNLFIETKPGEVFAIITYVLFCPIPREGYSATALSVLCSLLVFVPRFYSVVRAFARTYWWSFKMVLSGSFIILTASERTVSAWVDGCTFVFSVLFFPFYTLFWRVGWKEWRRGNRLLLLFIALKALNFGTRMHLLVAANLSEATPLIPSSRKLRHFWNNTIMDIARVVDNISLPNFIRSLPDRVDRDTINETMQIMESLGWPAAPLVTEEPSDKSPANFFKFADSFIGSVPIRQGIVNLELHVAEELKELAEIAPTYKRTEQYATIESELESVSRYFTEDKISLPELAIDDIWLLVGDIFRNSRLTPFSYILKKWEKKYGLGPFWGYYTRNNKWRKLSRKKFIKSIGGMPEMVKLWARTFTVAPALVSVAPVSVKSEALPEKKWAHDIVRTVIGAPVVHYIMSTIWNYAPNHNFKYWSTNVKVGMPLNGANLSKLIAQHSQYTHHFAGDFTAFDSTLNKDMCKLIAKVRKKGFEKHRDYARICFLIDHNYEALLSQPLATTSTGNIYAKRNGLSTGHSSTSMDNSIAVPILYLLAWKKLTGLGAHEFRFYNKLSNYGDDHLLSYLGTTPTSWTPANIIKTMTSFGVGMRDEEPSHELMKMSFLSKRWRLPTSTDISIANAAGVVLPKLIVYHDANKLIGKAAAASRDFKVDKDYRVKRLLSYLDLTAHHEETYTKLRVALDQTRMTKAGNLLPVAAHIPSYEDVLRKWYDEKSVVMDPDEKTDDDSTEMLDYAYEGMFDTLVNILSVVPDVLNPSIFNMGYTNYATSLFAEHIGWPIELIRRSNMCVSNTHLSSVLKKTCYDFLTDNPDVLAVPVDISDGGLLLRHWAFLALRGPNLNPSSVFAINWLDKKLATMNFMLNGYVQPAVKKFDFPLLQILLIAGLNFLPDVELPDFLKYIRFPSFSIMTEGLYSTFINTLWSKVPANMKQANAALENLSDEEPYALIEAPTGTGKSTTFVNFVWRYHREKFVKLIVIVPRHLVVTTVYPYLRKSFGLPVCPVTDGFPYDGDSSLILTTPAEFMMHTEWWNNGSWLMIDECHVSEPLVLACFETVKTFKMKSIWLSATPSDENYADCNVSIALSIASTWKVIDMHCEAVVFPPQVTSNVVFSDYINKASDLVRAHPNLKFLIFVVDKEHATRLATRIPSLCCVLSSDQKQIIETAQVFIATAVADVGITIPNVDWVVTSSLTREMIPNGPTSSEIALVEIGPALLTQRRGRTGRTNNGYFTCISYPKLGFIKERTKWSKVQLGILALQSGIPVNVVSMVFPFAIAAMWGEHYTREMDDKIDLFTKNYTVMSKVLDSSAQRAFKSLDSNELDYGKLWIVKGNTVPTSRRAMGPGGEVVGAPASVDDVFRWMVGASKALADLGRVAAEDSVEHHLRHSFLSAKAFFTDVKGLHLPQKPIQKSSVKNMMGAYQDPTVRFGKSTPPTKTRHEDDPFKDFAWFDDPNQPSVTGDILDDY